MRAASPSGVAGSASDAGTDARDIMAEAAPGSDVRAGTGACSGPPGSYPFGNGVGHRSRAVYPAAPGDRLGSPGTGHRSSRGGPSWKRSITERAAGRPRARTTASSAEPTSRPSRRCGAIRIWSTTRPWSRAAWRPFRRPAGIRPGPSVRPTRASTRRRNERRRTRSRKTIPAPSMRRWIRRRLGRGGSGGRTSAPPPRRRSSRRRLPAEEWAATPKRAPRRSVPIRRRLRLTATPDRTVDRPHVAERADLARRDGRTPTRSSLRDEGRFREWRPRRHPGCDRETHQPCFRRPRSRATYDCRVSRCPTPVRRPRVPRGGSALTGPALWARPCSSSRPCSSRGSSVLSGSSCSSRRGC